MMQNEAAKKIYREEEYQNRTNLQHRQIGITIFGGWGRTKEKDATYIVL